MRVYCRVCVKLSQAEKVRARVSESRESIVIVAHASVRAVMQASRTGSEQKEVAKYSLRAPDVS